MEGIYKELYSFLSSENVEEMKMPSFQEWLKWYLDNNLVKIERNELGQIIKAVFIRRLNTNDIIDFPEYLHPDIPNVDKITKFYIDRPDGNVYYCELLVDKTENIDDLKIENLNFAFLWAKERFHIDSVNPNDLLFYYKKGQKVRINLREIQGLINKILNYQG